MTLIREFQIDAGNDQLSQPTPFRFLLHNGTQGGSFVNSNFPLPSTIPTTFQHSPFPLLEGVGASSPPSEEDGETHGLDQLGSDADADGINGSLLSKDLRDVLCVSKSIVSLTLSLPLMHSVGRTKRTYTGSSSSEEDQTTQVGSALVAQGTSGIDEGADAVTLQRGADERGAPGEGGAAGLLGAGELLLGVGGLGALVGGAEQRGEDGELNTVVEGGA